MGVIKPLFPDGTYIKTNDLTRMIDYTSTLIKAVGSVFQAGILSGLHFSLSGTDIVIAPGVAMADDGTVIVIDATDSNLLITPRSTFFAAANGGAYIYLVKSGEETSGQRPNVVGQLQVTASHDIYNLVITANPNTLASPKVQIGRMPSTISATTTVDALTYTYALEQLTHTLYNPTTGKYSGPTLGTAAIANQAITHDKLKRNTDYGTGTEQPDGAVDGDVIRRNSILPRHIDSTVISNRHMMPNSITNTQIPPRGTNAIVDTLTGTSFGAVHNGITGDRIALGTITRDLMAFKDSLPVLINMPKLAVLPYTHVSTAPYEGWCLVAANEQKNKPLPIDSWFLVDPPVTGATAHSLAPHITSGDSLSSTNARSWHANWLAQIRTASNCFTNISTDASVRKPKSAAYWLFEALPPFLRIDYSLAPPVYSAQDPLATSTIVNRYIEPTSYWVIIGLYSDEYETSGNEDNLSRVLPVMMKLSNYTLAVRKFPEIVDVVGNFPFASIPNPEGDTRGNTLSLTTPVIIPPDGYMIEYINGAANYNGFKGGASTQHMTRANFAENTQIMPIMRAESLWRYSQLLASTRPTAYITDVRGVAAQLAVKIQDWFGSDFTAGERALALRETVEALSLNMHIRLRRLPRDNFSAPATSQDFLGGEQLSSDSYFTGLTTATRRKESNASVFMCTDVFSQTTPYSSLLGVTGSDPAPIVWCNTLINNDIGLGLQSLIP